MQRGLGQLLRVRWVTGTLLALGTVSCGSDAATGPTIAATTIAATTTSPPREVPDDWTTYSSTRFLYSMQYPNDWTVTEATKDWPGAGFPFPRSANTDKFSPDASSTTIVFVSSVDIERGRVVAPELDIENPMFCELSDRHVITVDGRDARQEDQFCFGQDYIVEVELRTETQFYIIDVLSKSAITEELRATFETFLASFHATTP